MNITRKTETMSEKITPINSDTKHISRHQQLHRCFDELLADFIDHNGDIEQPITDLIQWSYKQTIFPDTQDINGKRYA